MQNSQSIIEMSSVVFTFKLTRCSWAAEISDEHEEPNTGDLSLLNCETKLFTRRCAANGLICLKKVQSNTEQRFDIGKRLWQVVERWFRVAGMLDDES